MERFGVRTAIGLGIITAVGGALLRPDQHIMSAEDFLIRENVLSSYPFTYNAVSYLQTVPYFNRHTTNNGGGYEHNDVYGRWIETFSNQDEAILHEMSHAWYDHEVEKNPQFKDQVMNAMHFAVAGDVAGGYFQHLEWGFGDSWKGIDHSDATEWYASTASEFMGDVKYMPDSLQLVYKDEFNIDLNHDYKINNTITPGKVKKYINDGGKQ